MTLHFLTWQFLARHIIGRWLWALAMLAAVPAGAAALHVPSYPADLSSVERLHHSARYQVLVRPHGAGEDAWRRATVFETRNDWVLYDFFHPDPARRRDVLQPAGQVGLSRVIPGRLDTGKADLRTASFSPFSFEGMAVDVRIKLLDPAARARTVTVRPLRRAIPAVIAADGRTVDITLQRAQKLSVEINDRLDPLFLFADAPDVPDTAATHYFGPGVHRLPGDGTLHLKSHERVYIAAGAIVEGRFDLAEGSEHITIRGRGLLSGGEWPFEKVDPRWQYTRPAIGGKGSHHFTLEGITLVQSTTWQVALEDGGGNATHHNQYRNFKTVSWNGCTDGIWVTGDHNVVDDVFIFNNDDFFVTKGGRGTRVSNAVVWGGTWGRILLVQNIYRDTHPVEDLVIEHVDMIGKEGAHVLFVLESFSTPSRRVRKNARGITIRDLVVEERRRSGNSNNVPYNMAGLFGFDTSHAPGRIDDLTFEDIVLDQWFADEGHIVGTEQSPIHGLTLRNIRAGGTRLGAHGFNPVRFNRHVHGVRIE
ncbi:hypothetical protein [Pseudoduganella lutea]|uniref:Endo-polygalacturonase n=1 Tax=Pseudoduganella lutea TaxID=321985 RepID=A0A4P6KTB9_9BURK|nr:hypothetical protein [Pseudoduganella lutea]QBE61904.1 hypothetical protein EWM63_01935 [Pseudoduganella lutea]